MTNSDYDKTELAAYMFEVGFMSYPEDGDNSPEDILYAREVLKDLLGPEYFEEQ